LFASVNRQKGTEKKGLRKVTNIFLEWEREIRIGGNKRKKKIMTTKTPKKQPNKKP
jgi:hypothetical protein